MKLFFVIGTRPEIIKMYPVYKEAIKRSHKVKVFFTKQNYDKFLSTLIFKDFDYDEKDLIFYHTSFLNGLVKTICKEIKEFKADCVLVQGDTWSTLYGAVAAMGCRVKLGHVEAGIRSFDQKMIEEKIRIVVDNIADFLFVPTMTAYENIYKEIDGRPYLTGNTVYDLLLNLKRLKPKGYILVTLHRPETVDIPKNFINVLKGITKITDVLKIPARFLVHPRAEDKLDIFNIKFRKGIKKEKPVGYKDFIKLLQEANLVITDSGGLQEEAAILKVPCLTTRNSTERPETITANLNILTGYNPNNIFVSMIEILQTFAKKSYNQDNLYGEGNAGKKIISILEEVL